MPEWIPALLFHPLVLATLNGVAGAVIVDLRLFRKSVHSWSDFRDYDWNVATFRWAQGALGGFLMGLGVKAWL